MSELKHGADMSEMKDSVKSPPGNRRVARWVLLVVLVAVTLGIGYAVLVFSPRLGEFVRYGYIGAFLVTLICSTTIFFPTPGFIIIFAMVVSPDFSWPLVALMAGLGGGLGESSAYLAGYGGNVIVAPDQWVRYKKAEAWTRRYGGIALFVFSLAPFLPFDLAGIVAGAMKYKYWKFLVFTVSGRIIRSFTECYLVYLGWHMLPAIGHFLGQLEWWAWLFVALFLIVLTAVIVAIIWGRRRANGRRKNTNSQEYRGNNSP